MKVFNSICIVIISLLTGFFSALLFIGSQEDKLELYDEWFSIFLGRTILFFLLGFVVLLLLLLLNMFCNVVLLEKAYNTNLKQIASIGALSILAASLTGSIVFFIE